MDAKSLLALANLNKRDRYLAGRAQSESAKKEDWRWVGFDSTIGMGVVRSGNAIKRGKVITNGYLVPGQPVEFNEDGQFATIEGSQYVKPQPRSKRAYIPKEEPILSFKIAYTEVSTITGAEQLWVGGWSESQQYAGDIILPGGQSTAAIPRSSYNVIPLVNFDNLGGSNWKAQLIRDQVTGLNSVSLQIHSISLSVFTPGQEQVIPLFTGYEGIAVSPRRDSGMFFLTVGGGLVVASTVTRETVGPANNPTSSLISGEQKYIWNGAITSVAQTPYSVAYTAGQLLPFNGQFLTPALGESYYQVPPSGQLYIAQPLATDGTETFARIGVGAAATYCIVTSGGVISIPKPDIEYIDTDDFQINGALATLKLINRKIYYVQRSEMTLANLSSSTPGETGTVNVKVYDLIAGTNTTVQDNFYKIPATAIEILSCCYYPET